MNQRDASDYLKDILNAAAAATSFVDGMALDDFESDQKTVFAVTRAIEIIGEAAKSIPDSIRLQHPEIPWKSMAGMRDKVVHHYFGVDSQVLWDTVKQDIPLLARKITVLLNNLD